MLVSQILGSECKYAGNDWAAWDLERKDGIRVEIKQSAAAQSWGDSKSASRLSIAAPNGHYPGGKKYVLNTSGERLADLYVLAWHERDDQRIASEWQFYVV